MIPAADNDDEVGREVREREEKEEEKCWEV